jgi:hypothetical protein
MTSAWESASDLALFLSSSEAAFDTRLALGTGVLLPVRKATLGRTVFVCAHVDDMMYA